MLRGGLALVTGAARGIRAAVARRLTHDGLRIVLTDIRDAEGRAAAAEISTKTEYRRLDVREKAEWASVTTAIIEEYGRLDVLVNNAGLRRRDGRRPAHCLSKRQAPKPAIKKLTEKYHLP